MKKMAGATRPCRVQRILLLTISAFSKRFIVLLPHSAQRLGAGKNGLLTYERKPKCELKNIKQINDSWHAYTIYEE